MWTILALFTLMSWAEPSAQYGRTPGSLHLDDVAGVQRVETCPGILLRANEGVGRARQLGAHIGLTPDAQPTLGALHFHDHEARPLEFVREALRHRLNLLESVELGARVAGILESGLTIGQAAPRLGGRKGPRLPPPSHPQDSVERAKARARTA